MGVGDKVVVGVGWGVMKEKGDAVKNMLFDGKRSLFRRHSPGGATVLLLLIC